MLTVHNSTGDADSMIVACALQMSMEGKKVNVVADDTDVIILLMTTGQKAWQMYISCLSLKNHRRMTCKCGEYAI